MKKFRKAYTFVNMKQDISDGIIEGRQRKIDR